MQYYIKKLGKNELGVKSDGSLARGRFLYISKDYNDFFPHLSKLVKNDNVLIPIIPPFSNAKIYCTLVYHNDKFNTPDGTRDEYRLYLNRSIDPQRQYFEVDDIIIFQRLETENLLPLYFLYKFSPSDSGYSALEDIIKLDSAKGNHAFVEDISDFLPSIYINSQETETIIPSEVIEEAKIQQVEILEIDDLSVDNIEEVRGAKLFGPDSFRDFVLMAYGYKCAITGKSILYKNLNNLEAAHIQPKAQLGTFLPCNGIALSRDMHWAFDKGFISITDDYKIVVHDEMKNSELKHLDGQLINIPLDDYFKPEKKFLKHHRENIFGLFLHSGSIRSFI